jgi:hypothetical protein
MVDHDVDLSALVKGQNLSLTKCPATPKNRLKNRLKNR